MGALVEAGVATVIDLRHPGELASQPNPFHANPAVRYYNVSLFDQLAPTPKPGQDLLLELYILALDTRQQALAEVLTLIAEAPQGTVLYHCTAGKDRTGVVSALVLSVAGVDTDLIVQDYALTAQMIAPMIEEMSAHAQAQGANVEYFRPLLASDPSTMVETIAYIERTHGSAVAYLERIGLSSQIIDRLRNRLLGDV